MPRKVPPDPLHRVRNRAENLCEYCHTSERWQYVRFTVDHIVPLADGGGDNFDNLALACFHCNRRKSARQVAFDPQTGQEVEIFNPRVHSWSDHFKWSDDGLLIVPFTSIGRATSSLLDLNRERVLPIRGADVLVGRHPPSTDRR